MNINLDFGGLHSRQKEIFSDIIGTPAKKTKYYIIRASRQSGKTLLLIYLLDYFSLSKPDLEIGFINGYHNQNEAVFEKFLNITPKELIRRSSNNMKGKFIEMINGSIIRFYSAQRFNSIVGNSFDYLLCDEFSIHPDKSWQYIQPTVAAKINAKVILSGTPRGKNAFYYECMDAQKNSEFKREYRMQYTDNPFYDFREVENKRKTLIDSVFRQEYLAEFVFGQGQVFGDFTKFQTLKEWIEPISTDKYFFGLDIGSFGEDNTVLCIVNQKNEVCYVYETELKDIQGQANELEPIIKKYNASGYGEINGIGTGLCQELKNKRGIELTYLTTSQKSKKEGITNILKLMSENTIKLPSIDLCSKLDNEMSTYVGNNTTNGISYSHPPGLHDDYVDALVTSLLFNSKNTYGTITDNQNSYRNNDEYKFIQRQVEEDNWYD